MRLDPLQQYAKLHKQLTEEKSQLESRLNQINQVLGGESPPAQIAPSASVPTEVAPQPAKRRGRKPKAANQMSMREAVLKVLSQGPLARKDLVKAVEAVGYVFTTKNPLNSIGSILYAKNTPVKSKGGQFYLPENAATVTPEQTRNAETQAPAKKKRRKVSAEGRARMSAAQKARWAK
jgi:hypothetical protein